MKTLYRNATNRILFKLHEDPAQFSGAAVLFRQGGRIVLKKEKGDFTVEAGTDRDGSGCWFVSFLLTPWESRQLDPFHLCFAQIVVLRASGVQDPGEIIEFEVCDTLADVSFR